MNAKKPTLDHSRPERDIVIGVNSPMWDALSRAEQARWQEIRDTLCLHCQRPLGEQFWMLTWANGRRAHETCQDEAVAAER